MKISNETKIGALTAIAITLLVLGFNFLKGKTFLGKAIPCMPNILMCRASPLQTLLLLMECR
jgi:hypothetical protein